MDGAYAQVQPFERAEGFLDIAESFVDPDGILRAQGVGRLGSADHIDAVQRCFAGDGVLSAPH